MQLWNEGCTAIGISQAIVVHLIPETSYIVTYGPFLIARVTICVSESVQWSIMIWHVCGNSLSAIIISNHDFVYIIYNGCSYAKTGSPLVQWPTAQGLHLLSGNTSWHQIWQKSRSRNTEISNRCIVLKFERRLGSTIKFQSIWTILNQYPAAFREIWCYHV